MDKQIERSLLTCFQNVLTIMTGNMFVIPTAGLCCPLRFRPLKSIHKTQTDVLTSY